MKVLITGACGFLGRHFTKALDGYDLTLVDDFSNPHSFQLQNNHIVTIQDCRQWFQENTSQTFDIAIHLAAHVGGRESIEGLVDDMESIAIDASFFQWIVKARPSKVIYMSSSAAYPAWKQKEECVLREEDIDFSETVGVPDLVYGWSKLTGERLASLVAEKYDLDIMCPRPFSGYGEDQPLTYPFTAICKRALLGENPLKVWGSGEQKRDFVHVDDIVQACLELLPQVKGYQAINIGSGDGVSFKELAAEIAKQAGYKPPIQTLSDKPEGVKMRIASVSHLKRFYEPLIGLTQGIRYTFDYLKSHDKDIVKANRGKTHE